MPGRAGAEPGGCPGGDCSPRPGAIIAAAGPRQRRLYHVALHRGLAQRRLAEENTGRVLAGDLKPYRDDIVVSTKAGFRMRPGPYGEWGSRKYPLSSLDASLKRLQLDYVDIFYHHRPDPNTPLEESMGGLDAAVRRGKALYAAISNYNAEQTRRAVEIMRQLGTPLLANQCNYSMLSRWIEDEALATCSESGLGMVCFSTLSRGG